MPRDGQNGYVSGAQKLDDYYQNNSTPIFGDAIQAKDLVFSPIRAWADDKPPPPVNWLVDGCFIAGTVALLSSDGGLGKSLLLQQLCTAAAIGKNWLSLKTKRVKSFGLFCEDGREEMHRRQYRINAHYNCAMGDLEDVQYQAPVGRSNIICRFSGYDATPEPTAMFKSIERTVKDFGAQLICLDTVMDVYGGSHIAGEQVHGFINMLRRLAIECEACCILSSHVSNEGLASKSGISGHRGWRNHVRNQLWLSEKQSDEGGDIRYLRTMKGNWGKRQGPLKLRYTDGVFVNETMI